MRLIPAVHRTTLIAACFVVAMAVACSGCGTTVSGSQTVKSPSSPRSVSSPSTTSTASATATSLSSTAASSTTVAGALPGAGKPPVTIGDKNYTEQFLLGELYSQALHAQGFTVQLNQNIGPTDVTVRALQSGLLGMYPEYLNVFNSAVAKYPHGFHSRVAAYRAAQGYALAHSLHLLSPTPFSDTYAIAVTVGYAQASRLRSLEDLPRIGNTLTLGGPPESEQTSPALAHVEHAYDFTPRAFRPLAVGAQYSALNDGSVQAAEVQTTDGQLASGDYRLLADPLNVFAWGNVVPVVSARTLKAEGPAFATTIDKVSALLTTRTIRVLNQAVDVSGQDPAAVAHQFLETHGLIPPSPS